MTTNDHAFSAWGINRRISVAFAAVFAIYQSAPAQGIVAPGAGTIVRSFGGTAIAAPLDPVGALYWNPATLSFLDSRVDVAAEAIWKHQTVESTIPPNLLGPGNPPTSVTGKTISDDGMQLGPATAIVIHFQGTRWKNLTLGGGLFPYSGGGSNYPADAGNPTLAGLGGWYNNFVILAIPVAASYKLGKRSSIALAVDFASISWEWSRATFAHPDTGTINGTPVVQYAPAIGNPKYGVGVHLGGYYHDSTGLGFGVMVKSPIYFQKLDYNSATLRGEQRKISMKANTPFFLGAGVSYDGLQKWLFALDFKYAFYEHTTEYFWQRAFFHPDGTVNGLGYDNGFAITTGIQRKPMEGLAVRIGYKYSSRIVPDLPTFELTSSSLRHAVGGGFSLDVSKAIALHAGYVQSWAIPITGAMTSPLTNQPIAGSRTRLTLVEYAPSFGISVKY